MQTQSPDKKIEAQVYESPLISRDLSWVLFNYRVLDQAKHIDRTIFERLKFMAITASNLDEFFMIRVGSLYNYIDYGKKRIDYSGVREGTFRELLLNQTQQYAKDQNDYFTRRLRQQFEKNGFQIIEYSDLAETETEAVDQYFEDTIYPMITPMLYDAYHPFPLLINNSLIFGVVTRRPKENKKLRKLSFIQIPRNLPRFFEVEREGMVMFLPIESIIKQHIDRFFKNIKIVSVNLFRITRNGDFTLEESEDIEANFLEELKRKLKTRRTGRVVRIEVHGTCDKWVLEQFKDRWELNEDNIFEVSKRSLLDFTSLWQIINHTSFKDSGGSPQPVTPLSLPSEEGTDIFEVLRKNDVLLHHPYNTMEPLLDLLERSADDPNVLAVKITIYRVAKDSRVTSALLRAAENGKHISVLFEVKARFDEENNLHEAERLQKAGCHVIYGVSNLKTHTKLLLIVRKEGTKVRRYVHMASGNYNESTSRLYTDIGLLSSKDQYGEDVSEFFNVITGHSMPMEYPTLITSPIYMRDQLIQKIQREAEHARKKKTSGIVIKINSLQDKDFIEALYSASQAGVPIRLIIRGICCLRPGRKGLSENIEVCSIVGDYLEHSRIYYFHNQGDPEVYSGSADAMVRSFDRRLESLFVIEDKLIKQQAINILKFNLKDNVNSYSMEEDGSYHLKELDGSPRFNIHKEFYNITKEEVMKAKLFK